MYFCNTKKTAFMDTKIDMNYRFTWDTEPTDEQLNALMREVGEDVRRENEELKQIILANIKKAAMQ